MTHGMDERFWIQTTDDTDDEEFLPGWSCVVDADAGGIIAYAATLQLAQLLRETLIAKAAAA
jgi:hypothetical protein